MPNRICSWSTLFSRFALAVCLVVGLAGCHSFINFNRARSPLTPTVMSPESVVLDIFFVRCPMGDEATNVDLWREVDEQTIPLKTREGLRRNGFRAGVVTGQLPAELAELLQLAEKPVTNGRSNEATIEPEAKPSVIRRHLQTPPNRRNEVIASGIYPRLPVLLSEDGQVHGQTYQQAQGVFSLLASPLPDGSTSITLSPEVHHGSPCRRWTGGQGVIRLEASRPRCPFEDLSITSSLPPGAMLLVTCQPDRRGSLGYNFFSDEGHEFQKLLVIRLSQTQHDSLFSPPEVLALDELAAE